MHGGGVRRHRLRDRERAPTLLDSVKRDDLCEGFETRLREVWPEHLNFPIALASHPNCDRAPAVAIATQPFDDFGEFRAPFEEMLNASLAQTVLSTSAKLSAGHLGAFRAFGDSRLQLQDAGGTADPRPRPERLAFHRCDPEGHERRRLARSTLTDCGSRCHALQLAYAGRPVGR